MQVPTTTKAGTQDITMFKSIMRSVQSFLESQSHGRATAQAFTDPVHNLEICLRKLKTYVFEPLLRFFSSCFPHINYFLV